MSASRLTRLLFFLVLGTTLLCVLTQAVAFTTTHHKLYGAVDFFNMDREESFPTWLNACLLLGTSVLAWLIAGRLDKEKKNFTGHWRGLGWIFLLMSMDEVAGLHELVSDTLRKDFHTQGYLYYAFVVPGAVLALAVFLSYLSFLRHLPKKIARGMILSGALYLFGTIVMESLGGNYYSHHGQYDSHYMGMAILEEFSEMASLTLMIRTLLAYLESLCPGKTLKLEIKLG